MIMNEARRSEINDFNFTSRVRLYQNVLWFQITMNQSKVMNKVKGNKYLFRNSLQSTNSEVRLSFFYFSIVLWVLIEVVPEQFSYDEQMFFVIEEIVKFQ